VRKVLKIQCCTILFLGLFYSFLLAKNSAFQKRFEEETLVKVDNRVMTVGEFLQRSELMVRPLRFKGKDITLNNLIVEKVLAIEAEKRGEVVLQQRNFLQGIKEQAMRLRLQQDIMKKAKVDSVEVAKSYRLSNREYEVDFFRVRGTKTANEIKALLDTMPELSDEMFKRVREILGKEPRHKVNYFDPDDNAIHKALFSELLDVGTVIGPVALQNGEYIVMRVRDWKDRVIFGGEEEVERWNKVEKKMLKIKGEELWRQYQLNVMKGKKLKFNKEVFDFLASKAMEYYLRHGGETDSVTMQFKMGENSFVGLEVNEETPFFTIDDKVWTVGDFKKEVLVHPLLYRTTNLDTSNFRREFRNAIIDLVRDHYLTKEAYKRKLDKDSFVTSTVQMWKDSFLASAEVDYILGKGAEQGKFQWGNNVEKLNYWDSYLANLLKKYSDKISINFEIFDKVNLNKIDMVAWYTGAPYPIIVPRFPFFYDSSDLSYVKNKP